MVIHDACVHQFIVDSPVQLVYEYSFVGPKFGRAEQLHIQRGLAEFTKPDRGSGPSSPGGFPARSQEICAQFAHVRYIGNSHLRTNPQLWESTASVDDRFVHNGRVRHIYEDAAKPLPRDETEALEFAPRMMSFVISAEGLLG
ncbi:hypothetical protein ACFL2Q_04285 [Thermodesulfobacteriota bacterium]